MITVNGAAPLARVRARCPAHDDKTPSLDVLVDAEMCLHFHCFAGCSEDAVKTALFVQSVYETIRLGGVAG